MATVCSLNKKIELIMGETRDGGGHRANRRQRTGERDKKSLKMKTVCVSHSLVSGQDVLVERRKAKVVLDPDGGGAKQIRARITRTFN